MARWACLPSRNRGLSLGDSRMTKKLKPVHPGEILREEFMLPLRLSMNRVAMDLRVPVTRIADIVNEKRAITWKSPKMRLLIRLNAMSALWKQCQQGSSTISLKQTSACMARGSENRCAQTAVVRLFVTKYIQMNGAGPRSLCIFGPFLCPRRDGAYSVSV